MANPEHLKILAQGVGVWNAWRLENEGLFPDLKGADFTQEKFVGADLSHTNLTFAKLMGADLCWADLTGAKLFKANFHGAKLANVRLRWANLTRAKLTKVNLIWADLTRADLAGAKLIGSKLNRASLVEVDAVGAEFSKVSFAETIFGKTILQNITGLDTCFHLAPSTLDLRTLENSWPLPLPFLRGCGLPDTYIEYLPSLLAPSATQFYSCFISYSTKDGNFANRLYADLQNNGVRCWFAPEDIQGGKKLFDQIDQAIRLHDKLLLILSEESMASDWVMTEIRRTRAEEKRTGERKLFPLRLVDMSTLKRWTCFDADSGKDLAVEVREYFIPDFTNWKEHDVYQAAFARLLKDLKEEKMTIAEGGK